MAHSDLFYIFPKGHTCSGFNDPVDLALTVIKKLGQMSQGDGAVIFLHVFQNEDRVFIHDRRLYGGNDDILLMLSWDVMISLCHAVMRLPR